MDGLDKVIGYEFLRIEISSKYLNYLKNKEITYRDNREFNTINPNNINKNIFFFIIPYYYV